MRDLDYNLLRNDFFPPEETIMTIRTPDSFMAISETNLVDGKIEWGHRIECLHEFMKRENEKCVTNKK